MVQFPESDPRCVVLRSFRLLCCVSRYAVREGVFLRPDPVHIIRDHAGRVIAPSREIPLYEKLPSVYGPTARPL